MNILWIGNKSIWIIDGTKYSKALYTKHSFETAWDNDYVIFHDM